jgi:hypothetical protein
MSNLIANRKTARARIASFSREGEDLMRRRMLRTVNRVAVDSGGSLKGV